MIHTLFGPGTWGAGGNIVAWVLCGIPTILVGLWRHRKAMHARIDRLEDKLAGRHNPGTVASQQELSGQYDENQVIGFHSRKPREH